MILLEYDKESNLPKGILAMPTSLTEWIQIVSTNKDYDHLEINQNVEPHILAWMEGFLTRDGPVLKGRGEI